MKGVFPWLLLRWACRVGTRDFCSAVAASLEHNIFFLIVHYFNSFVPMAQQAGQAVRLGRRSLSKCLFIYSRNASVKGGGGSEV